MCNTPFLVPKYVYLLVAIVRARIGRNKHICDLRFETYLSFSPDFRFNKLKLYIFNPLEIFKLFKNSAQLYLKNILGRTKRRATLVMLNLQNGNTSPNISPRWRYITTKIIGCASEVQKCTKNAEKWATKKCFKTE